MKFEKAEITKEKLYAAKKPLDKKIWDVCFNDKVISKLIKTKINSWYLIGYLDKDIWALVLIRPKMNGYVKVRIWAFKVEYNNKSSFPIDGEKLLEKWKLIWNNIKRSKNIKLNAY